LSQQVKLRSRSTSQLRKVNQANSMEMKVKQY